MEIQYSFVREQVCASRYGASGTVVLGFLEHPSRRDCLGLPAGAELKHEYEVYADNLSSTEQVSRRIK